MEGLLNIKRGEAAFGAELAELEKKLALEKEQLNLDVAKSIFADENAAFYKKLHAFFTTRVTEVDMDSDHIVVYLDGDDVTYLTFEKNEDYEGEWILGLYRNGEFIAPKNKMFLEFIGAKTHLDLLIFFGAYEAFIITYLSECKDSYFTLHMFEQRWRK